ncbi:MAG TPA: hypothetical protein DEF34_08780 [Desulfotomaculum sp.]|nr:MAG: hypothetical protein VR67_16430 [Peptococcaceae bacterium BRH_c8a]KJS76632.1 MAG: hypothetical protein JL56_05025 [Desulfotomaculum sp. BICA1-6]HBX23704.1 hypothetical protein [Desulfotomaculum sp.]
MPSLHRIIRRNEGAGEPKGHYNLALKTEFTFETSRLNKQRDETSGKYNELSDAMLHQAKKEAAAIMDQAGVQAAAMLEEARQHAAAEVEKVKTAAAREGYEQGHQSALETAGEEAASIRSEARKVLAQAEDMRRQKFEQLKEELLSLAIEMAEKIVTRELETRSDVVLSIAEEAILLAGSREHVVLWINPAELEVCQTRRESLLALLPPRAELQIMTDPAIEPGGCVLENEYGKVDARLSNRWQNLLASLKQGTE